MLNHKRKVQFVWLLEVLNVLLRQNEGSVSGRHHCTIRNSPPKTLLSDYKSHLPDYTALFTWSSESNLKRSHGNAVPIKVVIL